MELANQVAAVAMVAVAALMAICVWATFEVEDSSTLNVVCMVVFSIAGLGCTVGAFLLLV